MILDVGCGGDPRGDVNIDLFPEGNPAHLSSHEWMKETPQNFIKADASCLPFRDKVFTLVYARMVLEHMLNPFDVLKEWRRVASVVYVLVPNSRLGFNFTKGHLYSWDCQTLSNLMASVFTKTKVRPNVFKGRFFPFRWLYRIPVINTILAYVYKIIPRELEGIGS